MPEEIRWIIDVAIGVLGLVLGYLGKTFQLKISNKKAANRSVKIKGDNNAVAGRDINNGTKV